MFIGLLTLVSYSSVGTLLNTSTHTGNKKRTANARGPILSWLFCFFFFAFCFRFFPFGTGLHVRHTPAKRRWLSTQIRCNDAAVSVHAEQPKRVPELLSTVGFIGFVDLVGLVGLLGELGFSWSCHTSCRWERVALHFLPVDGTQGKGGRLAVGQPPVGVGGP